MHSEGDEVLKSISSGPRDLCSQPGRMLACCVTLGPLPDLFKPWFPSGRWILDIVPLPWGVSGLCDTRLRKLGAEGMSWLASRERNGLFPTPVSIEGFVSSSTLPTAKLGRAVFCGPPHSGPYTLEAA